MVERNATVVDAHHHLWWDPNPTDYPWITDEVAFLRQPFTPADLRPHLDAVGVDRTVLVQTRSSPDETRQLMETAAKTDFVGEVVGWVDLTGPDVAETLAALRARPDGATLVGIRHQVHDEPDENWLLRSDVQRGLRAVADAGLVYDLLVRPRELPAALDAARALPDLRFVIDHIGKPPIRSGELEPWASLMAPFAELPQVACKLSGMVTEADWHRWSPDDLWPYVERVLAWFGPGRLMWGSDWPVCLLAAQYPTTYQIVADMIRSLTDAERAAIVGGNAARFYRLARSPLSDISFSPP